MWLDRLYKKPYIGKTDLDFAEYLINFISPAVELVYEDGELNIYKKNGLISQKVDKDWLIYWLQNILKKQTTSTKLQLNLNLNMQCLKSLS